MKYIISAGGQVISSEPDSWADGRPGTANDTFYGDHEWNPSPESLRAALRARNARASELRKKGFKSVRSQPLTDDVHCSPPRTTAYCVSAFLQ